MFNIYFEVEKNRLRMVSEEDIIAGTKNYLNANFKFSPEWDGMAKTVMFKHNGIEKPKLLVDSERTLIPWEVVQSGGFTVQVYGMRNGQIVASSPVRTDMQTDEIPVMVSGGYVANTTIEPPTPDIYEQIIDYLIDCINQSEFLQGNGIKRMWMDEDNILHLEKENGEVLDFPDMEGDSAYDIAVQLGFVGTEQEWIDSLHYDHSDEFVALAAQVARDALASADSASKAQQSQELAKQSEDNARTSADEASESAVNAKTSEDNALTYSNNAKTSETKAKTSETNALTHADNASNSATASVTSAKLSQSYAVGGTNSRAGEDTDNSKYYSEQAKASADNAKISEDNAKTSEENAAQSALLVANKEDFATIKADRIPEITNEATLRTYFYNHRKSTSRKWQFEISAGSNENIMAGLGGYPDSYSASDKAFVYIELPFSEAGGFIIKATYEGRTNGALYKQTIFGTLDSNWHTTGWIKIAKSETEVFNVTIEDDGFGNYTCSHNDNDINNARNAGKVVQAKYDSGTQTFTYYYSTMESDRKPTFIRTYIEDGVAKQVLASIGFDKKVTVERRVADNIVVDSEMSDTSENPVQNKVVNKAIHQTYINSVNHTFDYFYDKVESDRRFADAITKRYPTWYEVNGYGTTDFPIEIHVFKAPEVSWADIDVVFYEGTQPQFMPEYEEKPYWSHLDPKVRVRTGDILCVSNGLNPSFSWVMEVKAIDGQPLNEGETCLTNCTAVTGGVITTNVLANNEPQWLVAEKDFVITNISYFGGESDDSSVDIYGDCIFVKVKEIGEVPSYAGYSSEYYPDPDDNVPDTVNHAVYYQEEGAQFSDYWTVTTTDGNARLYAIQKFSTKEYIDSKTVVDTEMSDASENPVQNKVVKKYAEDTFAPVIVNSKSGSVVTINDILNSQKTVPVKVESNNLIPSLKTPTDSRITISESREIVVNGTFNATYFTNFGDVELEAGTYYISTNTHEGIDLYTEIDGQQVINKSFILSSKTRLTILIRVTDGVYNQVKCNIMLNRGTSPLPYTKHVDVANSKVKALGRNFFNMQGVTPSDNIILNDDKTITVKNGSSSGKIIKELAPALSAGTNVFLKIDTDYEKKQIYFNGSRKLVRNGESHIITKDDINNSILLYGSAEGSVVRGIQLSINSDTEIEPYKEPTTYDVQPDGTVVGVQTISPNMTLMSDTEGVTINTAYKADTKKYIDNKFKELESKITNTQALALEL